MCVSLACREGAIRLGLAGKVGTCGLSYTPSSHTAASSALGCLCWWAGVSQGAHHRCHYHRHQQHTVLRTPRTLITRPHPRTPVCWWASACTARTNARTPPNTPHHNTHPHPQDAGVLVGRRMHGAHHRAPFEANYAIVSGWWNPILDKAGFFRKLEKFVHE